MTDKKSSSAEKQAHGFGDIPIRPERDAPGGRSDRRHRRSASASRSPARRKQAIRPPKKGFPLLALLIGVAVLFLMAGAGLYSLPFLVKGPLADQLSHRLQRKVRIETVTFSPLDFHFSLSGITIGPDPTRKNEPGLSVIDSLSAALRPAALLQGRVVLEQTRVKRLKAELIRYPDGSSNVPPIWTVDAAAGGAMPSWLYVDGLNLTQSEVNFHDQLSGNHHTIKGINLTLPGSINQAAKEPSLQALINGSPVRISGRHHAMNNGETETRLSLQLLDIDPRQYLAFLPGRESGLLLKDGRTDATFALTFPGDRLPGREITLSGRLQASELLLQAGDNLFQLALPTAEIAFELKPFQSRLIIHDLTADGVKLNLPDNDPATLMELQTRLSSLLDPEDIAVAVEQLTVENGTVIYGSNGGWRDLRLQLDGFRNRAAEKEAESRGTLSLSAAGDKAKVDFRAQVDSSLALSGTIALQEMPSNLLAPFLRAGEDRQLQGERLALTGEIKASRGQQRDWKLTNVSLQMENLALASHDTPLLSAKGFRADGCSMELGGSRISCGQLSLEQADLPAGPALLLQGDAPAASALPFAYDALSITDATARLPIPWFTGKGAGPGITLTGLNLQLQGMKQGEGNLHLTAMTGKNGHVELAGSVGQDGRLKARLAAADINIQPLSFLFSGWLAPRVVQGTLQLNGELGLPEGRFSGDVQLTDFAAGDSEGPTIEWQQASAAGAELLLSPFSTVINRLAVQRPAIRISPAGSNLPKDLLSLLTGDGAVPTVEQCTINSGSLLRSPDSSPDFLPQFSEVSGMITPLQPGVPAWLTLTGKMYGADFSVSGHAGGTDYELSVNNFKPASFSPLFTELSGVELQGAVADWHLSPARPDSGNVQVTGLVPAAGSDLSLTLALLTDKDASFSLPVAAVDATDPAAIINNGLVPGLDKLRLQAEISPHLVLAHLLPELDLPREVEFLAGESVPDFMVSLEDYRLLLELRPHLSIALQGNFDDSADRQHLLTILQEAEDAKRELENIRREQLRSKMLADEEQRLAMLVKQGRPAERSAISEIERQPDLRPLPPAEAALPDNTLQDLARSRAEVIYRYFIDTLAVDPARVELLESGSGGTTVHVSVQPLWQGVMD